MDSDIRERDQDLDESEGDERFEFPPPERKITTQPYDLSIQTLVEQWKAKLLEMPEIQREYVWDDGRASRLIESLILGVPVPPLYFAETRSARFEVIDGHQRVRSIARYLNNEFKLSGLRVLGEYVRCRFHQLPPREQRFLKTRTLRVIVITSDSHPNMKFEVFERLNTGGISLNAQELRNSLYRGSLRWMKSPSPERVAKVFNMWGIDDVFGKVTRVPHQKARFWKKLGELVDRRNRIAHGDRTTEATANDISGYLSVVKEFCTRVDRTMASIIARQLGGVKPW